MTDKGKTAAAAADAKGMVMVRVIDPRGLKNDGKDFAPGEVCPMHKDLVGPHVAAGVVEIAAEAHG